MNERTICAVSTPPGAGGIAVIRVSGQEAITICDRLFVAGRYRMTGVLIDNHSVRKLADSPTNTVIHGHIRCEGELLDEVLVTVFRAPHSFTGEDTVEIACHGSLFIQQQLVLWLIKNGAYQALPGEFTQRAFINGKMDLSQAEAVADLIASASAGMHRVAINQMRGGFSDELKRLRAQLLDFVSLIELELDFGDHEELEFADRSELHSLAMTIRDKIADLANSFAAGNAIKNGIPVAIIGKPNVGKSTLLNALLNEDRAIVSDIPGTTRDAIEETINIKGQLFRFIDTAGLREHAANPIEALGIRRSFEKAEKASIILYLFDLTQDVPLKTPVSPLGEPDEAIRDERIKTQTDQWLKKFNKPILLIGTKNDIAHCSPNHSTGHLQTVYISCKELSDIERVKNHIIQLANIPQIADSDVIVTNVRHYEALCRAGESVSRMIEGLDNNLPGDLLAQDIRECTHYLGEITGDITTDEVLGNIFGKFCIGK